METDVDSRKGQPDADADPSFHRLDKPGQVVPYPQEGLKDNKTYLGVLIYLSN